MEWDSFLTYLFCFVFGFLLSGFITVVVMNLFLKLKKMDPFTLAFFRLHFGVNYISVLVFQLGNKYYFHLEQLI